MDPAGAQGELHAEIIGRFANPVWRLRQAAASSQLRIPSLTPSQISFEDNNLRSISVRLESLPLSPAIPLSDFDFPLVGFQPRLQNVSTFRLDFPVLQRACRPFACAADVSNRRRPCSAVRDIGG